jgi:uncharacterized protein
MRRCAIILAWFFCASLFAADVIPPKPDRYFNDYAHVVDAGTANQLNSQLEDLEKSSSDQVVVAIYPKMQSDSSIDDYANRVFRAWGIGQKDKNNGVVLFVFTQDRKMFIEVGYGLEGALPDALCKQITEYEIKPHFKAGDFSGGLAAGVNSIIAATRNEFKGTGITANQQNQRAQSAESSWIHFVFGFLFVIIFLIVTVKGMVSGPRRRGWVISSGGWGGFSGGGGWGGSSGGGGGFSGGGGSSGGGGAGSSW